MEKQIEALEGLIAENMAMKERSAFLEMSLGGLRCALENARWHAEFFAKAEIAAKERRERKERPKAEG